jgi:putative sigma-54 modulation protein
MDVQIVNRGAGQPVPRELIDSRIESALDRFVPHIARVVVTLDDVNGPRGGEAKHCKLVITLRPTEEIIVNEQAADVEAAVALAVDRAAQSVGRAVQRLKRGIGAG